MTTAGKDTQRLASLREKFHTELYDSVLPFWMRHSLDREHGGYFNCLDRDGKVWNTDKHIWLQGRQVWMLSKIHNTTQPKAELLEAARLGAEFLRRHARRPDNRVYFALSREGKPVGLQRKIFSECFYAMAMAEYARTARDEGARLEARTLLEAIVGFAKDLTLVGRPRFEGARPATSLAIPMILLNLVDVIHDPGETTYDGVLSWCVEQIDLHVRPELSLVVEHVSPDGSLLDSPEGRVVNPGHAIECGWFLLDYARQKNRADLAKKAIDMIEWSIDYGWDKEHGGLFYYLDREGYSPPALEWQMKLWWPHNELLVGCAKAYEHTGQERWLRRLEEAVDYTFGLFPDPEFGEWFGYFDRFGNLTHRFKGAAYKGCFHVPRALYLCDNVLAELAR